ncbi:MAG: hypothetical protein ACR2IV_23335 [Bryobacteraceae bacterium]
MMRYRPQQKSHCRENSREDLEGEGATGGLCLKGTNSQCIDATVGSGPGEDIGLEMRLEWSVLLT